MNDVHAAAARWADTWKRGWEALDADPIVALYADGAVLSTEPFREPYLGRELVRTYVTGALRKEADPRVWVADPIVDGPRASISWWASLQEDGGDTTLAGTSVLRFDDAGLVAEQWDAWNILPERREPPEGFGPFAEPVERADRSGTTLTHGGSSDGVSTDISARGTREWAVSAGCGVSVPDTSVESSRPTRSRVSVPDGYAPGATDLHRSPGLGCIPHLE